MLSKICAIIMSLVTVCTTLVGMVKKDYKVYTDVAYGTEEREVMDIYVPNSALKRDDNACLLFIHGGSWSGGDKSQMAPFCQIAAANGYIAATMSYTLFSMETADTFDVFITVDEIGMALQKIKDFSDENNLHITKAATSGYSSGAHISMLYSYSRMESFPLDLPFTMNMVGPSDLSFDVWGNTGYRLASMLSGQEITEAMIADGSAQAVVDKVSPVKYVTAATMPSLFAYAGKDNTVPAGNAQAVKDAFDAAGAPYDFILYPHADHIIFLRDPHKTVELLNALLDYCKTYFGY